MAAKIEPCVGCFYKFLGLASLDTPHYVQHHGRSAQCPLAGVQGLCHDSDDQREALHTRNV